MAAIARDLDSGALGMKELFEILDGFEGLDKLAREALEQIASREL